MVHFPGKTSRKLKSGTGSNKMYCPCVLMNNNICHQMLGKGGEYKVAKRRLGRMAMQLNKQKALWPVHYAAAAWLMVNRHPAPWNFCSCELRATYWPDAITAPLTWKIGKKPRIHLKSKGLMYRSIHSYSKFSLLYSVDQNKRGNKISHLLSQTTDDYIYLKGRLVFFLYESIQL